MTYEDVIELEKLKNDLYIDDIKVERIREQRRKKQKAYMEEVKHSSDRYSELRHMKVGVNYSIQHQPYRLADKATLKAADIGEYILQKQIDQDGCRPLPLLNQDTIPMSYCK